MLRTALVSFWVNLYLTQAFYPSLMKYQGGSTVGMWLDTNNPQHLPVVQTGDDNVWSLEFYSDAPVVSMNPDGSGNLPAGPFLLYTPLNIADGLKAKGWQLDTVKTFPRYWVSRLKGSFLNKDTRDKELTTVAVVRVNKH